MECKTIETTTVNVFLFYTFELMQRKLYPLILAASAIVLLLAFVAGKTGVRDFEQAKETIVMRSIGHRILQYTGDSSSRVLPVERLSENEFRIPFQTAFTFMPDSIVRIIDEVIKQNELGSNYIVNVVECNSSKLIYGYAIFQDKQNDVVPCLGRQQEEMRYCIDIRFGKSSWTTSGGFYAIAASLLIGGLALYKLSARRKPVVPQDLVDGKQTTLPGDSIAIGKYVFSPLEQALSFGDEKIILTNKEAKLLGIFAASPGITIDRNILQKIWEDEGVIVSRSLDVFISRLRKKLEKDPSIKLTNVHSKGYKLEVNA